MFYPNKAVYSILTTTQGALPNRGHGRKNARVRKQSKIYETTSSSKDTELQMPALGPYKVVPVTLTYGLGRDSGSLNPFC